MKQFLMILYSLALLSPNALASSHTQTAIEIKVNGMVCDFCAQSVWKVFEQYDPVENIDINLDAGIVTVMLKPGQTLGDNVIAEGITYAGYDLVSITKREMDTQ